ncbi:golgi integral membrane protein 4 [Caerostris darwini]|uniref:Golgi integral membrane protein 4 n=1 Tax=Caerostris darwini TaxID=1538125 RepID=A0AAV4VKH7_9ARAC|nr:golgi integral membrane protein 4 [Caerostris darwini]
MGEQNSIPSSNPVFIVIMRNSRGKLFVYVAVLGVLCFIGFLLSNTHTSLKELEGINEKCQQQRDSLSAQLQDPGHDTNSYVVIVTVPHKNWCRDLLSENAWLIIGEKHMLRK